MRSVATGFFVSLSSGGVLGASFALWGWSGLVLASCLLLLARSLFNAVAVARAELSQQIQSIANDMSDRLDTIESEISNQSDDDEDEDDDGYETEGEDEDDDEGRDSRRFLTPPSGIAYISQTLPARFQGAVIDKPRTYYFSLDEDEKWTVSLSKESCEVTRGKPATDADCVFEASSRCFSTCGTATTSLPQTTS